MVVWIVKYPGVSVAVWVAASSGADAWIYVETSLLNDLASDRGARGRCSVPAPEWPMGPSVDLNL